MENAGLYSVPDEPPPILVSGFGPWRSGPSSRSGPVERYRAGGASGPTIAALKVCWDTDEARARKQAHAHGLHRSVGTIGTDRWLSLFD
jgi:hypothetical protein